MQMHLLQNDKNLFLSCDFIALKLSLGWNWNTITNVTGVTGDSIVWWVMSWVTIKWLQVTCVRPRQGRMNAANQKLTSGRDVFPKSEKEPVKTIMGPNGKKIFWRTGWRLCLLCLKWTNQILKKFDFFFCQRSQQTLILFLVFQLLPLAHCLMVCGFIASATRLLILNDASVVSNWPPFWNTLAVYSVWHISIRKKKSFCLPTCSLCWFGSNLKVTEWLLSTS